MKLHVVEALRWGDRENHSYVVGVYTSKELAEEAAQIEQVWRGGKYTCVINEVVENVFPRGFDSGAIRGPQEELTGILINWYTEKVSEKEYIIWGNIYGDIDQRFRDGTFIHTSGVSSEQESKQGAIVQTRNSRYYLGTPLSEALPKQLSPSLGDKENE